MSGNLPVVQEEVEIKEQNIIYRDVTIGLVLGVMVGTFIGQFLIPRSEKVLREDEANTSELLKLEENTAKEPSPLVVVESETAVDDAVIETTEAKEESQVLPNVSSESNRVIDVSKYDNK